MHLQPHFAGRRAQNQRYKREKEREKSSLYSPEKHYPRNEVRRIRQARCESYSKKFFSQCRLNFQRSRRGLKISRYSLFVVCDCARFPSVAKEEMTGEDKSERERLAHRGKRTEGEKKNAEENHGHHAKFLTVASSSLCPRIQRGLFGPLNL